MGVIARVHHWLCPGTDNENDAGGFSLYMHNPVCASHFEGRLETMMERESGHPACRDNREGRGGRI